MFCPNCGANNSTEQKFCRSCGLNLEKSAESLLEQIPSAENAKLLKRERSLEKFGNIAFGGFGVVIAAAIGALVYYIFIKLILTGENVFFGILLTAFIIFAAMTLAWVIFNEDLKERKQKANPARENELTGNRETGKLLKDKTFEPVPFVTENTTDLLYTKQKSRNLE